METLRLQANIQTDILHEVDSGSYACIEYLQIVTHTHTHTKPTV